MTTEDHIALLRGGVDRPGGAWADLGSGSGAFTFALAALVGMAAELYPVERDARALRSLEREMNARYPGSSCHPIQGDFTDALPLPPLDGVVMANSLHFQEDACAVLRHAAGWLKPGGRLIVVEYDVQRSNPWVPYPLPSSRFAQVSACAGLKLPRILAWRPSRYHGRAYSAVCERPLQPYRSATGT